MAKNLKCPYKNTKLYKRLTSQLSEREAYKAYLTLTSERFDRWYADGKRDSDNLPIMDNNLAIVSSVNGLHSLFSSVTFDSIEDVEKFLSSIKTKGIVRYKSGKYFVSKNRRTEGLTVLNAFKHFFPGLLTTSEYRSSSQELGVVDQSLPIMRININQNYFERTLFNSEIAEETTPVKKENKREFVINRLLEYNVRINNRLKDAQRDKRTEDIVKYERLYNKNQENILKLQTENTISSVVEQAKIDYAFIQSQLKKDNLATEDIAEIGNMIDLYKNIADVNSRSGLLEEEDLIPTNIIKVIDGKEEVVEDLTELTKSIQLLATQFRSAENIYDRIIRDFTTVKFNEQFDTNVEAQDLFKAVKDLDFGSQFRDSSSVGNALLNLMADVRSKAIHKANTETIANQKERIAMSEGLKKSSLYKDKESFMKMLHQVDENGEPTGGLINPYSVKYWKIRSQYQKDIRSKDKNKVANAKRKHSLNHEYVNYFETESDKNLEIERLTKEFGLKRATEIVEKQDLKFQEYRLRKEVAFDLIDNEELGVKETALEKEIWELENNPQHTINNLRKGTNTPHPKGGVIFNSFEFVKSIPKKEINGVKTEWYDSTFEKIENDPIALEYYNYVKATIQDLLNQYPKSYLENKGIHSGFIPVITKDLMSEVFNQGLGTTWSGIKDGAKNLISIKTFDKSNNHIKPNGQAMNTLRISGLSPRYNRVENGKLIESEDVITDIDKILEIFIPITNVYKHKARVETSYNLIGNSINQLKSIQTNANDVAVTNNKDEQFSDKADLGHLKTFVQFETDTFYGQEKKDKSSAARTLTKEEKKESEQLKTELAGIELALADTEFLTEKSEIALNKRKKEIENRELELGVNLSATKSLRSILRYYQLLKQGWAVMSPMIELSFGFVTNYTRAAANIDYTTAQMRRAYSISMSSIFSASTTKGSKKFNKILEKFNVIGDAVDVDKNSASNSIVTKWSLKRFVRPYEFNRNMDKVTKGSVTIAVLLNTSITDINGNISNLHDALDDNANLKEEFRTEDNIANWEIDVTSDKSNDILRLRQKIIGITMANSGNYNPDAPIPFMSTAGGAAVGQFRRWMFEGTAQKFQNVRYDFNLKRNIKGRYRTYMSLGSTKAGIKTILASSFLLLSRKMMFKTVEDSELEALGIDNAMDMENMRKNAQGLMFTIALWMTMLLLKALVDDDDDEEGFQATKILLNLGGRLQQDMIFYASPSTATDITGNFIPATKLLNKTYSWYEACKEKMFDFDPNYQDTFKSGTFKGDEKWAVKTGELIPGFASDIQFMRSADVVYE